MIIERYRDNDLRLMWFFDLIKVKIHKKREGERESGKKENEEISQKTCYELRSKLSLLACIK